MTDTEPVQDSLFTTGVRPVIDKHLAKEAKKIRDYGDYWSASSVGYCYRLNIMKRLKIPAVPEVQDNAERLQRVFSAGHIFHEWAQKLTRDAEISMAQEEELQDDKLMVRGHFDDLLLIDGHMILYDYKTVNSKAFNYPYELKSTHRLQLGTYMYMLRQGSEHGKTFNEKRVMVNEARILEIEKDTLRMREGQLLWSKELEEDVLTYWRNLNERWQNYLLTGILPRCSCEEMVGAWMAKRSRDGRVFNDYFLEGEPCSDKWWQMNKPVREQ